MSTMWWNFTFRESKEFASECAQWLSANEILCCNFVYGSYHFSYWQIQYHNKRKRELVRSHPDPKFPIFLRNRFSFCEISAPTTIQFVEILNYPLLELTRCHFRNFDAVGNDFSIWKIAIPSNTKIKWIQIDEFGMWHSKSKIHSSKCS